MAPTYEKTTTFEAQYKRLTAAEQKLFMKAVAKVNEDLRLRKGFRKSLRVKAFRGEPGFFELTWAPDGRALFSFGPEVIEGEPHVVWHEIGGHEIFRRRP